MNYHTFDSYVASSAATSLTIAPGSSATLYPAGLAFVVVCTKNNDSHSCANPVWRKISQVNAGTGFTASLWVARNVDVVANSVFSWATSAAAGAQRIVFDEATGTAEVAALIANSSNSGTANPHTTASFNTTQPNALVVYIDASAANTALAQPSGWTERVDNGASTGGTRIVVGDKAVATPGTASGAISVTGAAAAWVQWQVELYVAAGTNTEVSKAESGVVLEPLDGLVVSKAEAGAVLDLPITTATVDLVEANVLYSAEANAIIDLLEFNVLRSLAVGAISTRRRPIVNLVT